MCQSRIAPTQMINFSLLQHVLFLRIFEFHQTIHFNNRVNWCEQVLGCLVMLKLVHNVMTLFSPLENETPRLVS